MHHQEHPASGYGRYLGTDVRQGLVGGLAGTAAMTALTTAEVKLGRREASLAPAEAVEHILHFQPASEAAERRLNDAVHWVYGTGWGVVGGLLARTGLSPLARTLAHFGLLWGAALVMLPRVGVAPPVREWGARELALDAGRHLVYAAAATAAIDRLRRREGLR